MRFDDTTGAAHVTFSEALVTLLTNTRRLESLGIRLTSTLQQQLAAARRLHRHGLVLHQVADFYNELSTRILPCHKSMLLADAQAFESVLLAPRDGGGRAVTWDNAPAVEGYVRRLQAAVQQLTDRNRFCDAGGCTECILCIVCVDTHEESTLLAQAHPTQTYKHPPSRQLQLWHASMVERIASLLTTDLLRNKEAWAAGVKELRAMFASTELQGFGRAAQGAWRLHIDYQLYKALQVQYCQVCLCGESDCA